jgi:hypothetical protein
MKEHNNIERILEGAHMRPLNLSEKEDVWRRISSQTEAHPFPLLALHYNYNRLMIPALLIALLLVGGTTVAADNAKPGDRLFEIDQAIEEIRLALATSDEAKAKLKIAFAEERLAELEKTLINKKASLQNVTSIEADVFVNETVVKLETSDHNRKYVLTTNAKTRAELVAEISAHYGLSAETVDSLLVIEAEDRASRPEDKDDASDDVSYDNGRKPSADRDLAAEVAVSYLASLSDEFEASGDVEAQAKIKALISRLETQLDTLPEGVRVQVKNDSGFKVRFEEAGDDRVRIEEKSNGSGRIEIREDGEKYRVDIKSDGEIRVRTDIDDDSDDDDSDDINDIVSLKKLI